MKFYVIAPTPLIKLPRDYSLRTREKQEAHHKLILKKYTLLEITECKHLLVFTTKGAALKYAQSLCMDPSNYWNYGHPIVTVIITDPSAIKTISFSEAVGEKIKRLGKSCHELSSTDLYANYFDGISKAYMHSKITEKEPQYYSPKLQIEADKFIEAFDKWQLSAELTTVPGEQLIPISATNGSITVNAAPKFHKYDQPSIETLFLGYQSGFFRSRGYADELLKLQHVLTTQGVSKNFLYMVLEHIALNKNHDGDYYAMLLAILVLISTKGLIFATTEDQLKLKVLETTPFPDVICKIIADYGLGDDEENIEPFVVPASWLTR